MNAMSKKILAQKQKKMEEAQVTQVNLFDQVIEESPEEAKEALKPDRNRFGFGSSYKKVATQQSPPQANTVQDRRTGSPDGMS